MGPENPNCETMEDNLNFGGLGLTICSKCGVVMMTALFARPHTEFNDGDEDVEMVCVFPGTFTEKMSEFVPAGATDQSHALRSCDPSDLRDKPRAGQMDGVAGKRAVDSIAKLGTRTPHDN